MAKSQKHRAGMVVSFTAFVSAGSGSAGEILFAVNGRGGTLQEAKRDARRLARRRMAGMSLTLLTVHESGPLPDCGGNESTPEGGTPAEGGGSGGNGATSAEGRREALRKFFEPTRGSLDARMALLRSSYGRGVVERICRGNGAIADSV